MLIAYNDIRVKRYSFSLLLSILSTAYCIANSDIQYDKSYIDSLYLVESYYTISQLVTSPNTSREEVILQSAYYHLHHFNFNYLKFQESLNNINIYDDIISCCFNDLLKIKSNIGRYDEALIYWDELSYKVECNPSTLLKLYSTLNQISKNISDNARRISILKTLSHLYQQSTDKSIFFSNDYWAKFYAQEAYNLMQKENLLLEGKNFADSCFSQNILIDTVPVPSPILNYDNILKGNYVLQFKSKQDSLKYIVESNAISAKERELLLEELSKCDTSVILDNSLADIYFRNHKYKKAIQVYKRGVHLLNSVERTPQFSGYIQANMHFILLQNIAVCYLWQNNSVEAEKYIKWAEQYIHETYGLNRSNLLTYYQNTNKYFDMYMSQYLQMYIKRQIMLSTRLSQLQKNYIEAQSLILLYDSLSHYDDNISSFDEIALIDYNSFQNETAANVYSDLNDEKKYSERMNYVLSAYKHLYNDILIQNREINLLGTIKSNRSFSVKERESRLRAYNKLSNFMFDKLPQYHSANYLSLVYEYTLFTKETLLTTEKAIYKSNEECNDILNNILHLKSNFVNTTDIWLKDSIQKQIDIKERILMQKVDVEYILGQHNITYSQLIQNLRTHESAIEFISYSPMRGYMLTDSMFYYALLSRDDSIISIPLFEEKEALALINTTSENFTNHTYGFRVADEDEAEASDGAINIGDTIGNGARLKDLVWSKILPYIREGETIYFAPSGLLHQLAIEALPYDTKRTMADVYNLVRLSSTRELVLRRQQPSHTTATLYGGIQYNMDGDEMLAESEQYATQNLLASRGIESDTLNRGTVEYLKYTKQEVENINQMLRESNLSVHLYTATNANEESFKALSGKHQNILHIATHGFFWTDSTAQRKDYFSQRMLMMDGNMSAPPTIDPLNRCGLLFAGANKALTGRSSELPEGVQDGILTAKEISLLDLRDADLVVLSACETGKGEITGEGVFGLQRAFKQAGAQTIIMSLWPVNDQATQLLMTEFYRNWITLHLPKRTAFKNAQTTVRSHYPEPSYWAGFIMLD